MRLKGLRARMPRLHLYGLLLSAVQPRECENSKSGEFICMLHASWLDGLLGLSRLMTPYWIYSRSGRFSGV